MSRKQGAWFSAFIVAVFAFATCLAGAQAPDYPVLGGSMSRENHNPVPHNSGPGLANLGWYAAVGLTGLSSTFIVDNTDFTAPIPNPPFIGAPYDFNSRGVADSLPTVTAANNPAKGWAYPTAAFPNDAAGAYQPLARLYGVGTLPANHNLRQPAYFFTNCTPSAQGTDPTIPENAADFRYFDWNYTYQKNVPPYVNISVNIPVGPTEYSVTGYSYPVRYYVYEVFYYDNFGNQQNYVQVVDSYAAGTGWYQLGGTNGIFPINQPPIGTHAITVRLLNTVPRDPNTGLLLQLLNGQPIPPGSESEVTQFIVYADATQFSPSTGTIFATPTSATLATGSIRVTMATNVLSEGIINGTTQSVSQGQVVDYLYNNTYAGIMEPLGQATWTYAPILEGAQAVNIDNPAASAIGFTPYTAPASHQGADYLAAPTSNVPPAGNATATYTPTLVSGTYLVYAFIPGNATGQNFATGATYIIDEGASQTSVTVNQSLASGWVQIGTRRFNNNVNGYGALKVVVTNFSGVAADGGTFVYADAIRFVGASNLNIVASPIHYNALISLTPGGTPTATDVVIVADENGVIHCIDATGNGDGTTTEYWSYPSSPEQTIVNWFDPNLDQPKDPNPIPGCVYDGTLGTLLAEMPTGFGMSSGVVERVNTNLGPRDFLYVTTTNGRVYCIAMQGRGDFQANLKLPGTTQRVWTYPATYPSSIVVPQSSLGQSAGSPAFSQITNGPNTYNALFVPTQQGRMYALNAYPNNLSGTTTPIWTYPLLNQAAVGAISVTPAIDTFGGDSSFPMMFFGTQMLNDNPAQFFALNANNGQVVWTCNAVPDPILGAVVPFYNFVSSPCTVSAAILNQAANDPNEPTDTNVDTVYTINSNNYVYAFNALTGPNVTTGLPVWETSELGVGAQGALSYCELNTYDPLGSTWTFPMLMVPASGTQEFYGLFARLQDTNIDGGRLAWGFGYAGSTTFSSMSNSNSWLYGADSSGYLYAFDQILGSAGYGPGSGPLITQDNPEALEYRTAKVRIVSQTEYNLLLAGNVTYAQGTPPNGADPRSPVAFDWGESAYIEVYDFPYAQTAPNQAPVPPPVINLTISTEGHSSRTIPINSQQFTGTSPNSKIAPNPALDGYAVYRYAFVPQGPNAIPPGSGNISISLSTYAANNTGALSTISLNPATSPAPPIQASTNQGVGWSQLPFTMANPLAIEIPQPTGTADPDQSLGVYTNPQVTGGAQTAIDNPSDAQNMFNGSLNVAGAAFRWDLLQATPGSPVYHNSTTSVLVNVFDRSLVSLIYPPGQGLTNVRVDRHDLAWQGDNLNITSQFSTTLYPTMEDLPNNYPNTSLDYPNMTRDGITITAFPATAPVNPLIGQGVTLLPPTDSLGNPITASTPQATYQARLGVRSPFEFQIAVPRFQPSNNAFETANGMANGTVGNEISQLPQSLLSQGYLGRANIYIDSASTGQFTITGPVVDTYRGFNLSLAVAPTWDLQVTTPNVDLGPVPAGTDYDYAALGTLTPEGTRAPTTPWPDNTYYQPFTMLNEGNVNFLDLRLVKASSLLVNGTSTYYRWGVFSPNNDTFGFMDSFYDVWSDFDTYNAPPIPGNNSVFPTPIGLQKARTTDLIPTSLSPNPTVRTNFNTGVAANGPLNGTVQPGNPSLLQYMQGNPRVGVTVPIGLPVGDYSQLMRVVENAPGNAAFSNEVLDQISGNSFESYTDPSFTLSFTVTETRLTGNAQNTSTNPMLEILNATTNTLLGFSNVQPTALRDPNGGLVAAWVSNRQQQAPTAAPAAVAIPAWRIYLAGVGNSTNFAASSFTVPGLNSNVSFSTPNPLGDLDSFQPATNGTWFKPSTSSATGYPELTGPALSSLFLSAGSSQTLASASFGSPSFPADGMVDKVTNTGVYPTAIMGFVGEAQLSPNSTGAANAATSTTLSRLFAAAVQSAPANGAVTVGPPILIDANDSVRKGKPAIIQRPGSTALIFYPGISANASNIYYSLLNGSTATTPYPIDFGGGFQSVDSVSALARIYSQTNPVEPIVELTFTGKLRGGPNDEVFFGRLNMNTAATQLAVDTNGNPLPFVDLAPLTFEKLSATTAAGVYRSRGVNWDITSTPVHLVQVSTNGTWTNLLLDGYPDPNFSDPAGPWDTANYVSTKNTQLVDKTTGIISYDTRLGGKVYLDPELGTVKFVSGAPSPSTVIRLSYQPRFLRVSDTAGAYSSPSGMFDTRVTSDPLDLNNGQPASFVWRIADTGSSTYGDDWASTPQFITNDRYVFTYDRQANGSGQAARPYMSTRRLGVPLQYPVYVNPNGVPGYMQVQWIVPPGVWGDPTPKHYYQIDPIKGRIYVEAIDEGVALKITYQAADPTTGALLQNGNNGMVIEFGNPAMISETAETPVLMNNAVDETGLNTFLDPFSYSNQRRPPLMWLFWSSTRNGVPDVYFETLSPMFFPRPNGINQ
jgi:hypothetical protein